MLGKWQCQWVEVLIICEHCASLYSGPEGIETKFFLFWLAIRLISSTPPGSSQCSKMMQLLL